MLYCDVIYRKSFIVFSLNLGLIKPKFSPLLVIIFILLLLVNNAALGFLCTIEDVCLWEFLLFLWIMHFWLLQAFNLSSIKPLTFVGVTASDLNFWFWVFKVSLYIGVCFLLLFNKSEIGLSTFTSLHSKKLLKSTSLRNLSNCLIMFKFKSFSL